ncbi:hypothetical protein QUB40_27895 [Microcoleus sp. AT9_A2]
MGDRLMYVFSISTLVANFLGRLTDRRCTDFVNLLLCYTICVILHQFV